MDFFGITGYATNLITNATSSGVSSNEAADALGVLGGLIAIFFLFFIIIILVFFVVMIAIYVYSSWALMSIAKRAKTEPSWLAWIPIANLYLLSKIAKMHWWPILLLIPYFFCFILGFIPIIGILFTLIGWMFIIAFTVFTTIWWWKTFEAVGRPGWWAILCLIPIVNLVFIGIAAWGNVPNTKKSR